MESLMLVNSLPLIEQAMLEVTEASMQRAGEKMDPVGRGETIIGTLTSDVAKRLYCTGLKLATQAAKQEILIKEAENDRQEAEYFREQHRLSSLAKLTSYLFWDQVYCEMGMWGQAAGVRTGWQVIVQPATPSFADLLRGL